MSIIRRDPRLKKQKGGAFAKGKKAVAICQRSGFKYLQSEMVFEPGTNLFVHRSETDGSRNLVTDPLNFHSEKLREPERIGLKHPSPDVPLSIGAIISAEQLGLPSYASVSGQFIQYASTAWVDPESGFAYQFNFAKNSFYIMTRGF